MSLCASSFPFSKNMQEAKKSLKVDHECDIPRAGVGLLPKAVAKALKQSLL